MSGVIPAITRFYGTGGNNVAIVKTKFGIRKITPRECFNAQGFPKQYKLIGSNTNLYCLAGNSVSIPVIKRIALSIRETKF